MPTFLVFSLDGSQTEPAYEFTADTQIELAQFPYSSYRYEPQAEAAQPVTSKYQTRTLTKLEWRKLLLPSEEQAFDKIRANVESIPLPDVLPRDLVRTFVNRYEEATYIDLDDPDQLGGLQLLYALGAITDPSRIQEIMNG